MNPGHGVIRLFQFSESSGFALFHLLVSSEKKMGETEVTAFGQKTDRPGHVM
jgi:hypothetical protein